MVHLQPEVSGSDVAIQSLMLRCYSS